MQITDLGDLSSNPFFKLSNKRILARLFKIPLNNLKAIAKNGEKNYQLIVVKKGSKKPRPVQNPIPELKAVQKIINSVLKQIKTPSYLFSGKKGLSYVDNADFHKDSKYVYTLDISSF